jgi:hypothetical protein
MEVYITRIYFSSDYLDTIFFLELNLFIAKIVARYVYTVVTFSVMQFFIGETY